MESVLTLDNAGLLTGYADFPVVVAAYNAWQAAPTSGRCCR